MKKIKYNLGDVFSVLLDENDSYGYGRIIKIDKGLIFVELYKVKPAKDVNLSSLKEAEPILQVWAIDRGLKNGKWLIIGNIPVQGEVTMPDFWTTDAFTGKILLIKGDKKIEITKDQIGNAQPSGIFGDEAVKIRYTYELKERGLL